MAWFGPEGTCSCCDDPDDPCPEKKVCGDPATYPIRVAIFRFNASNIGDTWSGDWEFDSCTGYTADLLDPTCCGKTTVNEKIEWELSGFAALNGIHDNYVDGAGTCNDVCNPCTLNLPMRVVKITGTLTHYYQSIITGAVSCDPGTLTISGVQDLCGIAFIEVDTVTKEAWIVIPYLWHKTKTGDDSRIKYTILDYFSTSIADCSAGPPPIVPGIGSSAEYCEGSCTGDYAACDALSPTTTADIYTSPSFICGSAQFNNAYTTFQIPACSDTDSTEGVVPDCDPGTGDPDCVRGINNSYADWVLNYTQFANLFTLQETLAT